MSVGHLVQVVGHGFSCDNRVPERWCAQAQGSLCWATSFTCLAGKWVALQDAAGLEHGSRLAMVWHILVWRGQRGHVS